MSAKKSVPKRSSEDRQDPEDRKDPTSAPTRRSLLSTAWIALLGVAILEGLWVISDLLRPRRRQKEERSSVVVAGPVERFQPGSVTAFPQGKFYLARLEDGGFLALSRRCTHLGCTVPWDPDAARFVCPCHASSFDLKGQVISPPAPRALDLFAVRIENQIVKVETGKPLTRSAFEDSQVAHPGSTRG